MTTNYAKASYQEIIDLKTVSNNVTVVGIHTPTSKQPYEYLSGFFRQFKKYRYLGCSMALVPAARLPSDIAQVGYEAGQQPVDARDILNPILFHGCHGNALGAILNQFLNGPSAPSSFGSPESTPSTEVWDNAFGKDSAWGDMYESLYYRALTDNTWLKAHPQSGFRKKGMHPLVYEVSTNHQIGNVPSSHANVTPYTNSTFNEDAPTLSGMMGLGRNVAESNGSKYSTFFETLPQGRIDIQDATSNEYGKLFNQPTNVGINYFTSRLHPLGWLDTTNRLTMINDDYTQDFTGLVPDRTDFNTLLNNMIEQPNLLPLLYMGLILLPPAYKANQYMRLVLNHRFAFKGFRGISTNNSWKGQANIVGGSNFMDSYYPLETENSKSDPEKLIEKMLTEVVDDGADDTV